MTLPHAILLFFAAMFGPAKLPADIAARLSKELNAIMERPQMREQIDRQGFALAGSTPEELGVSNARPVPDAENDRDAIHRLQRLGADFHLRALDDGYQFVCWLPTSVPGRNRRFEAVAASGDEAVLHVLDEAEKWAGQK